MYQALIEYLEYPLKEILVVCNFRGWSIDSENLVCENSQLDIFIVEN